MRVIRFRAIFEPANPFSRRYDRCRGHYKLQKGSTGRLTRLRLSLIDRKCPSLDAERRRPRIPCSIYFRPFASADNQYDTPSSFIAYHRSEVSKACRHSHTSSLELTVLPQVDTDNITLLDIGPLRRSVGIRV